MATFDPRFMPANVPTTIVESFPFIVPKQGPGMHQMMLYAFAELVTNRIQFGTFANIFNSLYRLKYDFSQVSYYQCYKDRRDTALAVGAHIGYPEPYGKFNTTGEYNGMKLSRNLVKRVFVQFMNLHEPYLLASFRM
jgi:hypothetical protein